jgi:hypothetical protein
MPSNPRLDAFKELIMAEMRSAGPGVDLSKNELLSLARKQLPEFVDDSEPCYQDCKHSAMWIHKFERAIYDLRTTRPPKIKAGQTRGCYRLA